MSRFVDGWMDQFDALPSESARKLCALALCNLLTIPNLQLLEQLGLILASITSVCHELEGGVAPARDVRSTAAYAIDFANDGSHAAYGPGTIGSEEAQPEIDRKREVSGSPRSGMHVLKIDWIELIAQLAYTNIRAGLHRWCRIWRVVVAFRSWKLMAFLNMDAGNFIPSTTAYVLSGVQFYL